MNPQTQNCSIEDLFVHWSTPGATPETCQIVDIREPAEFATEHIPGARNAPLSAIERHLAGLDRQRPVFIVCHWGNRSQQAAQRLARLGFRDLRVVIGGMLAWTAAELPVEQGGSRVWSLERQVRFLAGGLTLLGALLAWLVHPAFALLSGVIGAGLMYAAAANSCAMALFLSYFPWNQQAAPPPAPSVKSGS